MVAVAQGVVERLDVADVDLALPLFSGVEGVDVVSQKEGYLHA
jgi:hypothetical protein